MLSVWAGDRRWEPQWLPEEDFVLWPPRGLFHFRKALWCHAQVTVIELPTRLKVVRAWPKRRPA